MILKRPVFIALLSGLLSPCLTLAAAPLIKPDPGSVDLGPAAPGSMRSISIALKLNNRPALESYIASTIDSKNPNFRKFLTPEQFSASYGQPPEAVNRLKSFLEAQGLVVSKVYANNLVIRARGSNAQLQDLFNVSMHQYSYNGQVIQHPVGNATIPPEIQSVASGIFGLSTQLTLRPNFKQPPVMSGAGGPVLVPNAQGSNPNGFPDGSRGNLSVLDFARQYNVNPLYQRGRTGHGTTIGIITFAHYDPQDAIGYWSTLGLNFDPGRITYAGITDNRYGGLETTLDVQQSGGVAPGASIVVYEPITDTDQQIDEAPIDVWTRAVIDNKVDVLSTSWGSSEWNGSYYTSLDTYQQFDAVFLQAAAQGIPVIVATGDAGAYDLVGTGYFGYCTAALSVQFPAHNPNVLAAGGTTLPFSSSVRGSPTITITTERPWAWDYFKPAFGNSTYYASYFPVGGGGGVSVVYPVPDYQQGLYGVKTSAAGQLNHCNDGSSIYNGLMPANFLGRNIPDVSLNADPVTGYSVLYGGNWVASGGTSFVAPQLAGIVSLLTEELGGRVGFLNPQLYGMLKTYGYGPGSPFNAITYGSNLFYTASSTPGYNPASGIGTLNVDNLAKALSK